MAADGSKSGRRRRRSPSSEDRLQEAEGVSVAAADAAMQGAILVPVEHAAPVEDMVRAECRSSNSLQEATTALIQAVDEAQRTHSLLRQRLTAAEELNCKQRQEMDELRAENVQLRSRKQNLEELVKKQRQRINEHETRLRALGAKALAASGKPGCYKRLRRLSMGSQEPAGSRLKCVSAQKEDTDTATSNPDLRHERKGRKSLTKDGKLATKPFRSATVAVTKQFAGAATETNGTTVSGGLNGISDKGAGRDDVLNKEQGEAAHRKDVAHSKSLSFKPDKDAETKMFQRQLQSADPDGSRTVLAAEPHLPERARPERSRDREALERLKNVPGLRVWATNPAVALTASGGLARTASSPALIQAKEKELGGSAARAALARASTSHAFQPLARSGSSRNLAKPNDLGSPSSRALVAMPPPQGQVRAEGSVVAPSKPNSAIPCRCVVRGREKRLALPGFDCEQCRNFHMAVGGYSAAVGGKCHEGPKNSRHRYEYEPVSTPDGFWDLSFPVHQHSPLRPAQSDGHPVKP
eukprot:TRINITY_DN20776_c0_g2_i1.p1 TRINITY_DN20776_c0_g2~~TRINITY_DN20776_c0_g2_i1.p1  ORF type:complete len:526 (-),score=73.55 TRINITY_DN20776_c0_g2_i1:275-1852(-)